MAAKIVFFPLQVSDEAFAYLAVQRGKISDLRYDRAAWLLAYNLSIYADYESLLPYLPEKCARLFDVGSGLGGIDAVLARHYGGTIVTMLDGNADAPVVLRHSETFNFMSAARRFMAANGVPEICSISPPVSCPPPPCDLVISLQSWCFHFSPATYLEFVLASCAPGATVILDVRREELAWQQELAQAFRLIGFAGGTKKSLRMVFHAR